MEVEKEDEKERGMKIYRYVGGKNENVIKVKMMKIINGGENEDNKIDFKELMIIKVGEN